MSPLFLSPLSSKHSTVPACLCRRDAKTPGLRIPTGTLQFCIPRNLDFLQIFLE